MAAWDKLRIAHIISALGRGGMEFAVARLAVEQKKMGARCMRHLHPHKGPTEQFLNAGGVPVHLCAFKSRLHPVSVWKLRRLLRKLNVDVVQTHNYRPNVSGVVAAKLAGVPAVISSLRTVNRWDNARQFWMDRLLCLWRDAVVCVSDEVRKQYLAKIKWRPQIFHVIYNGIDSAFLAPRPTSEHLLAQYNINRDGHIIITVARLVPIKDHATLLRAFRKILDVQPNVRLLILGDGPLKDELMELAKSLGVHERAHFVGHQDNTIEWLRLSNMFILSTHVEGFSSAILEAMASGLPVIATKVGGNIESVQDGVTGFLTPPQDADAIAEKAILLMRNPQLASSFGIAGSRVVASKFTIQSNAQNTIALYRKILEKRRLS